jgi:hypothetical protein
MAVWTTFAALTNPNEPELDTNFNILSGLTSIPCTVAGTNTLALTNIANSGSISAYANYMRFSGIAAATNTGATTAQFASLAALNVYKDTPAGPVALAGNEIVIGNEFTLIYDLALNGGLGGFHLKTGGSELVGQTITTGNLVVTGQGSFASVNITGPASFASVSVSSLAFGNQVSVADLFVGSGQKITRMNTGSISISSIALVNAAASIYTVTVTGASVNDACILGPPAQVSVTNFALTANATVANSILLTVRNISGATSTIAPGIWNIVTVGST